MKIKTNNRADFHDVECKTTPLLQLILFNRVQSRVYTDLYINHLYIIS